nr:hypothetical protein [Phytobacter sp.]
MIYSYSGQQNLKLLHQAIAEIEGGTVSPGGAAALLQTSRQNIRKIVEERNDVRAWAFYHDGNPARRRAQYMYISIWDLIAYGVRLGRIEDIADLGLGVGISIDEFRAIKNKVEGLSKKLPVKAETVNLP